MFYHRHFTTPHGGYQEVGSYREQKVLSQEILIHKKKQ